jgi:hypothetical protein
MESKRATKETGIPYLLDRNCDEDQYSRNPNDQLPRDEHPEPGGSVIPVPLASSVIGVVTRSWN